MKKTNKKASSSNKSLQKVKDFKKHHRTWFYIILALLVLLILWLILHKPMSDAFSDIFGTQTPAKSQKSASGLKEVDKASPIADTSGGQDEGGGGSGGTSGSTQRSTSTTTNNTTNTSTTTTNGGGSGGSGGGNTPGDTTDENGLINAYARIYNGQSETQLLGLGIGQPNCLVTVALLGEQKVCTWTEGNANVVVTLLNGNVVSKTKLGF
jgi:cytoskeletal protein RodZ